MIATTYAVATLRVPGFHRWPDAPDSRSYLRERHRHLFHVKVMAGVSHGDREVEVHDLIDRCLWFFDLYQSPAGGHEFDALSCEQIALRLADFLAAGLGGREIGVEVLEDGEAGGAFWMRSGGPDA